MLLPDRFFSATILTHSVPKHSALSREFLQKQLPEILRVTDTRAYMTPMQVLRADKYGETHYDILHDYYYDEESLREVAAQHGFSVELYSTLYVDGRLKYLMSTSSTDHPILEGSGTFFEFSEGSMSPVSAGAGCAAIFIRK